MASSLPGVTNSVVILRALATRGSGFEEIDCRVVCFGTLLDGRAEAHALFRRVSGELDQRHDGPKT